MCAAYMAQDRPDVAEAVKPLSRRRVALRSGDIMPLKRLGRCVLGRPRASLLFCLQELPRELLIEGHSHFAGDLAIRRSTTGVCVHVWQSCHQDSESATKNSISLSPGESELYPAVKGSATGLGIQSLLAEWEVSASVTVASDSSAARGLASKRDLSNTRHIATRFLWLQERVRRRQVKFFVSTLENRGDLFTKALAGPRLDVLARRLAVRHHHGSGDTPRASLRVAR